MLIGLRGEIGSGKDEVAAHLLSQWRFTGVKFAEAVWTCLLALDPIVAAPLRVSELLAEMSREEAKRRFPELRRLLQRMGTEVGREVIDSDLWVTLTARELDAAIRRDENVVVSDVRFPNEAQAIRNRGGAIVLVRRPGQARAEAWREHVSEHALANQEPDAVIQNDGTLADLYARAGAVVVNLRARANGIV